MAKKAKSKKAEPSSSVSPESAERERKYQVEDGLRTLSRAEEVRADPKLMRDISAHAKEQAEIASRTATMIKGGLISDKQAARMQGKAEAAEAK